ncbi:ferredoxin [Nanoarchaeota archaeon]
MAKYKIVINRDECIGCGACEAACSKNYKLDSDNKSVVKKKVIDESDLECNKEAVEICPVDVIKISKV